MTGKPSTPTPIAEPQTLAEQASWVASLYYTKSNSAAVKRALEAASVRSDEIPATEPVLQPQPPHDTEANDTHPE